MGYVPQGATEDEHRAEMLALRRREIELREFELKAKKNDAFWSTLGAIATIVVPLVTFLGLSQYFKVERYVGKGKP